MSAFDIGVLGAGAWGTAIAIALARDGMRRVCVWAREPRLVSDMAGKFVGSEMARTARAPAGSIRLVERLPATKESPATMKLITRPRILNWMINGGLVLPSAVAVKLAGVPTESMFCC